MVSDTQAVLERALGKQCPQEGCPSFPKKVKGGLHSQGGRGWVPVFRRGHNGMKWGRYQDSGALSDMSLEGCEANLCDTTLCGGGGKGEGWSGRF